jgi:hypothetical protein
VLSSVVNNKVLSTNVATLTTAAAHGYAVGDEVTVTGVDSTFNGTHTITAVGTATTFSFSKVTTDVDTASVSGGAAVVPAGSRTVNTLPDEVATSSGYNVPGSATYNADEPIDFVLRSTEDPTD